MKSIQAYEHKQDEIEWNKAIKRGIVKYNQGERKTQSFEIMDLIEKQVRFGYELDEIILDDEQYDFVRNINEYLNGKLPKYRKNQEIWNSELMQALGEERLLESIALMGIGRKLGYVKSVQCISENPEYIGKLTGAINRIIRELNRNEETR